MSSKKTQPYDQSPLLPETNTNPGGVPGGPQSAAAPLTPPACRTRSPGRRYTRVTTPILQPSLTKQSFKSQCNIDTILANYKKTGVITHANKTQPQYGDFLQAADYQLYQNKILQAQDAFNSIPSNIRAEFDNDPQKFLEFAQNPENIDAMRELGLAAPEAPKPPTAATPAPEPEPSQEPAPAAPAPSPALSAPIAAGPV